MGVGFKQWDPVFLARERACGWTVEPDGAVWCGVEDRGMLSGGGAWVDELSVPGQSSEVGQLHVIAGK
jgi:hypothetical protein